MYKFIFENSSWKSDIEMMILLISFWKIKMLLESKVVKFWFLIFFYSIIYLYWTKEDYFKIYSDFLAFKLKSN